MKVHTTNYFNTFIEVAEDTKAESGTKPPSKDKKTVAEMQYELISENPYKFTSDDIFFQVFAERNDLTQEEYKQARGQFFSKGQPCFRASPLPKTYGFGIHSDDKGKVALCGLGTPDYQKILERRENQKSESNEVWEVEIMELRASTGENNSISVCGDKNLGKRNNQFQSLENQDDFSSAISAKNSASTAVN